jgi:hypothetical protein
MCGRKFTVVPEKVGLLYGCCDTVKQYYLLSCTVLLRAHNRVKVFSFMNEMCWFFFTGSLSAESTVCGVGLVTVIDLTELCTSIASHPIQHQVPF